MGATPADRLAELGIELPAAPRSVGVFVQAVCSGNLALTSGQIAVAGGAGLIAAGAVGSEVDIDTARSCAHQCALNVLAQLEDEFGLEHVRRVLKLTVFVASAPGFTDQHLVANSASELIAQVFGGAGVHCRSAIGVAALPLNSPVEVEATVELDR